MMSLVITPSNVLFLGCLRKFHVLVAEKEAYRENRPIVPIMRFSTAVHAVLKEIYSPGRGVPPHLANLDAYLHFAFAPQPYTDEQERASDIQRARKMILSYVDQDEDSEGTLAVEKIIRTQTKTLNGTAYTCSTRLDRVLVRPDRPGTVVVRDYKMGRSVFLHPLQIFLYLAAAKSEYDDRGREFVLEIDAVSEEGVHRATYSSQHLTGVIHELGRLVARYAAATNYPAEPSDEQCLFCPLKPTCQPDRFVDAHTLDF